MKKLTAAFLSLLLTISMLASTAMAAEKPVSVQVDGEQVAFAADAPIIENGVTYVPLEPLFQALEIKLDGATSIIIDDQTIELTTQPKTVGGKSYIAIRSIAEAAGYTVQWDSATRTVILKSKAPVEAGRGFLWEVKKGNTTVYLLGSMHVADDSFYPLNPLMEQAFEEADYLGVEVDITKASDPATQQLVMDMGTYKDGTTLKDHISADTYKKLGDLLEKNGMPRDAFDQFKPWVVESSLVMLFAGEAGMAGEQGIDLYFMTKAIERKLPIIELESMESQLKMFDGFSKELAEANLLAMLESEGQPQEGLEALASMWKTGDDAELLEFTEAMGANEEYNKAMLTDRNIAMTAKIEGYLNGSEEAVYLIVVGAAHMLGEHGIVTLLEDKGFTVTRK